MSANTKLPLSIFTGQNAALRAVTRSHGILRPNLVQDLTLDPKLAAKRVDEYDNKVSALTYYTFDGVSGSFKYVDSNQGLINALLMDRDPAAAVGILNPANYQPFSLFGNRKGLDGKIKGAFVAYLLTAAGHPFAGPLKEGANRTLSFDGLQMLMFDGLALQYTRARGGNALQAPPAQPALGTTGTGGLLVGGDTIYVQLTGVTPAGETTASNEAAIHIPTGTSTNKVTVTVPALAGTITSYNIYAYNRSNGERFVANAAPGSVDILNIPTSTAAKPPLQNTSGVFDSGNDKVFTGSGPWTVTLDNPAYKLEDTGLDYALILKDGAVYATVDDPAQGDTLLFDSTGATFSVNEDPANHVWELFTLYQP